MEICYIPAPALFSRRMPLFFSYLFLFAIPSVFSTSQLPNRGHRHPHLSNASDQEALLGFMSAIRSSDPSQSLPTNWAPNVSFCGWTGIQCSRRRERVVSLNLSSMGLQGTISPLLGNLSFLTVLDLHNNSFHGHIPYQLGSLFRLKMLELSRNQLQGSIPSSVGMCRSLQRLSMSRNNLTGNIPAGLCLLPKLQFFNLGTNNLTGAIPPCLGNISSLHFINLCNNNLHGSVPPELGMLSQLSFIFLCNNHLTGQISSSFSNSTHLIQLDASENQFSGHIPAELCAKNNQLMGLYLFGNQLSGSIPASLFNCTNLQVIDLGRNQLSGVLSMELGKLMKLLVLDLQNNQLVSGSTLSLPILTALTNCSALHRIDLSSNRLTGQLPFSIGQLSEKLDYLNLGSNELVGEIPPQIGNLTSLALLELYSNSFTGSIPSSFSMLQRLERLFMGDNNLQRNIPTEIGQLKNLGLLDLQTNNLSGKIPDSVASLQQLSYLSLAQNQLSVNIPASLGECRKLLLLDLSYNRLTGHIPSEVAGLENLALFFNLSNNLLYGILPSKLSRMTMLQAIDISANQLTGYIPSMIGCEELVYLNLSCNALECPIPVSLGELQNLEDMDLSSNNLSEEIPMLLENLKMLNQLNFSFNKLSGEVPEGGVFKKLGASAFMGNPSLCGPWVSLLPCSMPKHKSVSQLKRAIIPVVAIIVTIVFCLFFGILWRQNHKKHILIEANTSLNVGHQKISYEELITATNEFSDANLLGVGSFGKVYKGLLNDGTMVAVKLLNLEKEGIQKSFDKECKVLEKVRHQNLIRIITSYSDHRMKALVFPLMPNGSLENWLCPTGEVENGLSLIQRLNIAIDIAQGMTYLHSVQVIHCDLKPSNVLLGEDMTGYLIDFGIATICFTNSEDSTFTSTHGLKGSVGYIPPEYGLGGRVTTKGDVYSYGIVLLETLTGKKPTHDMFAEGMNLQKWVAHGFPNQVGEVVDKSLLSTSNEEDKERDCLSELISVGLFCTKESPEERPTMMDIVVTLQNTKGAFMGIVNS